MATSGRVARFWWRMIKLTLRELAMANLAKIVMRARGAGLARKSHARYRFKSATVTVIPNMDQLDVAERHARTLQLDCDQ